jgi:hypothetical protein
MKILSFLTLEYRTARRTALPDNVAIYVIFLAEVLADSKHKVKVNKDSSIKGNVLQVSCKGGEVEKFVARTYKGLPNSSIFGFDS